ncbi:Peroxisomal biogenesis factor 19 [Erysiphe necator]|uniref:Putative pex19-domain-containing protein n=1 Tax=Uncinula necator TaxID=52586 RepID=A0A0B1PCK4_UNCNE|nr:Peroxisomal biogenesis factor 19 [Erysiphe necator]KHJ36412.1 putative pex19-domain-containing protein [Erysiphe necator]
MEKRSCLEDKAEASTDEIKNDQKLKSNNENEPGNEVPQKKSEPSAELKYPSNDDSCDDLDDLDDMLDEFGPVVPENIVASNTEPQKETITDDDLERQLQAGMAKLFGDIENPIELSAKFENILKELGEATAQGKTCEAQPSTSTESKEPKTGKTESSIKTETETSFQDTIKKTMERMELSGEQATAAAAALENNGDILSEMLKAIQGLDMDGEAGGEEDFSKALLGMMEQLTNKEILYEPMKELNENYPGWLEKHAKEVNSADLERYKKQQVYVSEIVKRFESEKYDDNSVADKEYIVERMQKMQTAGSPPSDLVGDMAAAQEIFGAPEEGCPMQ